MDAPRPGTGLQLREEGVAVADACRGERRGIDHCDPRRHVREPAPEGHDQRLEPAGELLADGAALLELPDGFVADLHELLARERILVLLDALEQEFLILLLERPRRPPCDAGAGVPGEAQHGSTCTVTSWSRRSRLRRSSTSSAIAWADSTS